MAKILGCKSSRTIRYPEGNPGGGGCCCCRCRAYNTSSTTTTTLSNTSFL